MVPVENHYWLSTFKFAIESIFYEYLNNHRMEDILVIHRRLFKFKMNLIVSWHTQCFLKLIEKDAMKKKNKISGNIIELMY